MRRRAIFSTAQRVDFNAAALSRRRWSFTGREPDALTTLRNTRDLIRKAGEPSVARGLRDFRVPRLYVPPMRTCEK